MDFDDDADMAGSDEESDQVYDEDEDDVEEEADVTREITKKGKRAKMVRLDLTPPLVCLID